MLKDNLWTYPVGENALAVEGTITQNNIPILDENYVRRMNANNGFSKERLFRKIGSVPLLAVLEARQKGYNMDDPKDIKRFLQDNPDYMTVEKIDSHRPANIIIK